MKSEILFVRNELCMLKFQTWWTSDLLTLFNVSKVVHHNHHDTVSRKVFKANFGSCKSHKLNTLRQKMPLLLQNSFQPHQSEFWAPVWLLGLPKMATGSPGPSSTTHLCRQVTKFVWIFLDLNSKFIQNVSWIHT